MGYILNLRYFYYKTVFYEKCGAVWLNGASCLELHFVLGVIAGVASQPSQAVAAAMNSYKLLLFARQFADQFATASIARKHL